MVVGDLSRWVEEGRDIGSLADVAYVSFCSLDQALLDTHAPGIILSPLVADTLDAMDIAARLAELGFQGLYRALSTGNGKSSLIKDEVRAIAPSIDFDILEIK